MTMPATRWLLLASFVPIPVRALAATPARDGIPSDEHTLCSALWIGPNPKHPNDPVKMIVRSADVIVRAVASRLASSQEKDSAGLSVRPGVIIVGDTSAVVFDFEEVLKGDSVPSPLVISGSFTDHDDFNRDTVPYMHVRMDGEHGSCFAQTYRQGAELLLILERGQRGRLSPYSLRFPLMPVNEQLHGADDPWLAWVAHRSDLATETHVFGRAW